MATSKCLVTSLVDCKSCTDGASHCVICLNNKFLSAISAECIETCEETYCGDTENYECVTNNGKISNCE